MGCGDCLRRYEGMYLHEVTGALLALDPNGGCSVETDSRHNKRSRKDVAATEIDMA